MDFNEALRKKQELTNNGYKLPSHMRKGTIFVVPSTHEYFMEYVNCEVRSWHTLKDNTSIGYAKDNLFALSALWTDGANVLHHLIPINK